MSTGTSRNLRGIQVRPRDAAGEVIPEPVNASGEASLHAYFAQTFRTIAAGLRALPENVVDAVRALPESFFPPPWVMWMLLPVLLRFATTRRAREFVRTHCPIRCRFDPRTRWTADPAIESDEFECTFVVRNEQINVYVLHRTQGIHVPVPVRVVPVSAWEVLLHPGEDFFVPV